MPAGLITLDGIEYVRKDTLPKSTEMAQAPEGPFVIVRCRNAGVHAGTLIIRTSHVLQLANSRRLWRWWSTATLSELAMQGPLASRVGEQKYGCVIPTLYLTVSDVAEVIPCSAAAARLIMDVPVWVAAS